MIARTRNEARDFCAQLWALPEYERDPVEVTWDGSLLSVWREYERGSVGLDHAKLMALARFFGTMNVGAFEDIEKEGCEETTEAFIKGLREAAAAGQDVVFS